MKPRYNSATALTVALCALGLTVGSSLAGNRPKRSHDSGTIKSLDAAKHELTITDKANRTRSFTWNDSTRFRQHTQNVSAAELKPGESVYLTYREGAPMPALNQVEIVRTATTAYKPKSK